MNQWNPYWCNAALSLCDLMRCDPNISALFKMPLVPAFRPRLISTGKLWSSWLGHEPDRTCCGCDKWIVFRFDAVDILFDDGSVQPIVLSSKTGLSMEYAVVEWFTGDFDRLIFVIRLIRLTVEEDWDPIWVEDLKKTKLDNWHRIVYSWKIDQKLWLTSK